MQIGVVLPQFQSPKSGETPSWTTMRSMALRAEELGFDTVWVADELLWDFDEWPGPRGWWEGVAMAGAVAASTSRIEVGTWVLSALHRNPGLTAKVVATLDEISGGRFLFGFGSGHARSRARRSGIRSTTPSVATRRRCRSSSRSSAKAASTSPASTTAR
jgi:alkanesulfonate monooxygenase SsuD/methylene tetrahydromethanopterin reductase-like flavin-dependent oxidoreductase (luciferase family)